MDKMINLTIKGVLPAWKITLIIALLRNTNLFLRKVILKQTQIYFAFRLRKIDKKHPLVIQFNRPYYTNQKYTKLQRLNKIIPKAFKPILVESHYCCDNCINPIKKINKKTAVIVFTN